MPYTLAMGFVWVLLALLLGAIIGWLLRSIRASRQIARARSERNDTAEVEALRGRVANLEPLVGENDRLKAELEACRASKQGASGGGSATAGLAAAGSAAVAAGHDKSSASAPKPAADASSAPAKPAADTASTSAATSASTSASTSAPSSSPSSSSAPSSSSSAPTASAAVAASAPAAPAKPAVSPAPAAPAKPAEPSAPAGGSAPAAPAQPAAKAPSGAASAPDAPAKPDAPAAPAASAPSGDAPKAPGAPSTVAAFSAPTSGGGAGLDANAASAALGRKIKIDDLTVVEGIGPKISELCHGIGVTTWRGLADTETSLLRTMLRDAGPRFQMHDPETWPRQAELLANGDWAAFAKLTDELDGGRPS